MAMMDRSRQVMKAAGAASAAAPYLRRAMADEHVRDDLRTMLAAANRLYRDAVAEDRLRRLVTDDRLPREIDHMVEALQDAGRRVIKPRRRTNWTAIIVVGGLVGAGAMAWPRSRNAIIRFVRGTGSRASQTVGQAGQRVGKATEAVTQRVDDIRQRGTDATQAA
jgi:hypothetical protein